MCHSRAARYVLGVTTPQLNGDHDYGGVVDNQIRALDHIGIFAKSPSKPIEELSRLANPHDQTISLEQRARSYLHANCSSCHVPDGGGNAKIDLEILTELAQAKLIDEPPTQGEFAIPEAKIITPGDPVKSVLYHRITRMPGQGRMPPLASSVIDREGTSLIREWIESLTKVQVPAKSIRGE